MTVKGTEYDITQGDFWIGLGEVLYRRPGLGTLNVWRRMYVAYEHGFISEGDNSPVLPFNWIAGVV